jgi:hypothetical protein
MDKHPKERLLCFFGLLDASGFVSCDSSQNSIHPPLTTLGKNVMDEPGFEAIIPSTIMTVLLASVCYRLTKERKRVFGYGVYMGLFNGARNIDRPMWDYRPRCGPVGTDTGWSSSDDLCRARKNNKRTPANQL